jgi:hypothetical protein
MISILVAAIVFAGLTAGIRAAVAADLVYKPRLSQQRADLRRPPEINSIEKERLFEQFQEWLKKQLRPTL